MLPNTLAFVAGMALLHSLAKLPPGVCYLGLLPALFLLRWRATRLPAVLVIGFFWAAWRAELALAPRLDSGLEATTVLVEGTVQDMPVRSASGILRLQMFVERLDDDAGWRDFRGRVRLNWYDTQHEPAAGERWRLAVRLKQPHGFANPGGFDYERWLFQQRIRATGYVREDARNRRLAGPRTTIITATRTRLQATLTRLQDEHAAMGMIRALSIGDRSGIDAATWETLRATGTSHLMAISGLHISLMAGMVFWLARRLWARAGKPAEMLPARRFAALLAVAAALLYALLAGFGIPARRALVMVTVVMFAVVFNRRSSLWSALCLAAVVTLLIDPLSLLSAGWWLSFWAVTLIAYLVTGRQGRKGVGAKWIYLHLLLAVGMLPVLLVFFQSASVVAPLANMVAVPWVSLLVVPLALLGSFVVFLHQATGEFLLVCAANLLQPLWSGLGWLAEAAFASWQQHQPLAWTLLPAFAGLALLLMPRGIPGRWLGGMLLLPMFLVRPDLPQPGEVRMTLLDVGQGLAAVVSTRHHVLVYDTGPGFSEAFDTGAAVVVPYLRKQGVRSVDTLVVSHGDNDHIGGAASLLSAYLPQRILSSVPERLGEHRAERCLRGQRWRWDGVGFEILHPGPATREPGNNTSCVLKIETRTGQGILLSGDIEGPAERELLRERRARLPSTVLVVPHHGSNTSSSAQFVQRVAPAVALFPAGYLNRYRFPKQAVVDRYTGAGTTLYQTGHTGAITVRLAPGLSRPDITLYREVARRYWMPAGGSAGHLWLARQIKYDLPPAD